jgi:hypothetical protein
MRVGICLAIAFLAYLVTVAVCRSDIRPSG